MEIEFLKSLQMIRILEIKSQEEYEKLYKYFLVLSIESLKFISQKNTFKEIKDVANNFKKTID